MKKQLLSIALFLASLTSFAQLDQGKILVGGGLGISTSKPEDKSGSVTVEGNKQSNYFITPAVGYFIAPNFALGLNIGIGGNTTKSPAQAPTPELKYKNRYFVVGPFGRYYKKFGDNFAVFGQLALDFRFGKIKDENYTGGFNGVITETETKYNSFSPNLRPGIVFFPYEKVGIELLVGRIGYDHIVNKNDDADTKSTTNAFEFRFDLSTVNLGVFLYL